jgi:hypothetical protein
MEGANRDLDHIGGTPLSLHPREKPCFDRQPDDGHPIRAAPTAVMVSAAQPEAFARAVAGMPDATVVGDGATIHPLSLGQPIKF